MFPTRTVVKRGRVFREYQQAPPEDALPTRSDIRKRKLQTIKDNLRNLQLLGGFTALLIFTLFLAHAAFTFYFTEKTYEGDDDIPPPYSSGAFDFSYLSSMFGVSKKRDPRSKVPEQIESFLGCDLDRVPEDSVKDQEHSDWVSNSFRNKKPFVLYFQDSWVKQSQWKLTNLNKTHSPIEVSFGKSLDTDKDLQKTSFENFLKNLLGDTDLRGEPWQIRDSSFLSYGNLISRLPDISIFKGLWKGSGKPRTEIGTTLSGVSFRLLTRETVIGVIKGRTRVFLYPPRLTPLGGYDSGYDMISWFTGLYPTLGKYSDSSPIECIIDSEEILYVPESWFMASINLGTTMKVIWEAQDTNSELAKLLIPDIRYQIKAANDDHEILPNLLKQIESSQKSLPESSFLEYQRALVLTAQGEHTRACDILLALDGNFLDAKIAAVQILREDLDSSSEALKALMMTEKLAPDSDKLHREIALTHLSLGDDSAAAADAFRRAAILCSHIDQQLRDLAMAEIAYRRAGMSDKVQQVQSIAQHVIQISKVKAEYIPPFNS